MPTYEYACAACGHEWEQSQRITEAPIEVCPKCGQSMAHRLISGGTNFILKGGGWYSDLYASPKTPKKADEASASPDASKSGEAAATGGNKTGESKGSDSKPAATKTEAPAAAAKPAAPSTPASS